MSLYHRLIPCIGSRFYRVGCTMPMISHTFVGSDSYSADPAQQTDIATAVWVRGLDFLQLGSSCSSICSACVVVGTTWTTPLYTGAAGRSQERVTVPREHHHQPTDRLPPGASRKESRWRVPRQRPQRNGKLWCYHYYIAVVAHLQQAARDPPRSTERITCRPRAVRTSPCVQPLNLGHTNQLLYHIPQ